MYSAACSNSSRYPASVRSPAITTAVGLRRFISIIVRSRSSGIKRELPQWMSLIWHMVNRPLPMFVSKPSIGLDDPRSLSDDQSSSTSYHRREHYIVALTQILSLSYLAPRKIPTTRHRILGCIGSRFEYRRSERWFSPKPSEPNFPCPRRRDGRS